MQIWHQLVTPLPLSGKTIHVNKVDGNLIGVICDHPVFLSPMNSVIFPITVSEIPAFGELLFLAERYYRPSKST